MTKQEFIDNMKPYALLFKVNLEPEVSKIWFELIEDLSVQEFNTAFKSYLKESQDKWFPLPGQVLAYHKKKPKNYFDTEEGKSSIIFKVM